MVEDEFVLEQLGLEKNEAKIYLLLIKLGESSAVSLARESGLHRRTAYDVLEKLQKKGLVNLKIKKFVKHFSPTNPEALEEMMKEKQRLIKDILPKLSEQYKSKEKKISINIFEGIEGMKTLFSDLIKTCIKKKEEIILIGAGLKTPNYMKHAFPHYIKQMNKMKWRLVEPDTQDIRERIKEWDMEHSCRFLPEKYLSPMGIVAFADRTIIMLLKEEPRLIEIRGVEYANAFKNYFEIVWASAKK
ncbi:MAG: helix-turn-helix domain-containing protein [Candidatus Woesearchaeota archaeon]|nr:helix-turn-helix domain-containing protein [Candidatus Woesearchaeota archaeon]